MFDDTDTELDDEFATEGVDKPIDSCHDAMGVRCGLVVALGVPAVVALLVLCCGIINTIRSKKKRRAEKVEKKKERLREQDERENLKAEHEQYERAMEYKSKHRRDTGVNEYTKMGHSSDRIRKSNAYGNVRPSRSASFDIHRSLV